MPVSLQFALSVPCGCGVTQGLNIPGSRGDGRKDGAVGWDSQGEGALWGQDSTAFPRGGLLGILQEGDLLWAGVGQPLCPWSWDRSSPGVTLEAWGCENVVGWSLHQFLVLLWSTGT